MALTVDLTLKSNNPHLTGGEKPTSPEDESLPPYQVPLIEASSGPAKRLSNRRRKRRKRRSAAGTPQVLRPWGQRFKEHG